MNMEKATLWTTVPNLSPSLWYWNTNVSYFFPFDFLILAYSYFIWFLIFMHYIFFLWFLNSPLVFEEMLKLDFGFDVWIPIVYARAMLFTDFF